MARPRAFPTTKDARLTTPEVLPVANDASPVTLETFPTAIDVRKSTHYANFNKKWLKPPVLPKLREKRWVSHGPKYY